MKYSLINVSKEENGLVEGIWMQDFTGTLKSAKRFAREIEKVNSSRITVAVVEAVSGSTPSYHMHTRLKKL